MSLMGQNPPPTLVTSGDGTCFDSGRGGTEPDRRPPAAPESFQLAGLGSLVPEQLPRLDAQSLRDARDVVDRHVALRALDAEVGPIDPAFVRERLLAEPARGAQSAHVLGQDVPQRSLVTSSSRTQMLVVVAFKATTYKLQST
jgi:hypothetical protein